ncbi:MAG: magnesium/cobalt transporter CorA [Candidatus Promineifilaceae bacterium]
MIRILYRVENGEFNSHLQVDDLVEALKDPFGLLWIDLLNEPLEVVEPILSGTFGFHPLAVDDAIHESHVPKVDDWQEYLFMVLKAVNHVDAASDRLQDPELDVFLGSNFIVTCYQEPITAVDRVWELCQKDQRWKIRGAGQLLYRLVDELVSEAVSAVELMHDELDYIEEQLFSEAGPVMLERIFTLRRNILLLRRIVVPQRDVLNNLARHQYLTIKVEDRIFFRDIYDHLNQLNDLLEDMLILSGGARDTYLSLINNHMNDIMKTLTVITALFMPLAFITGFFGMNFFQRVVPHGIWTSDIAFATVMVVVLLVPLSMFLWMRHRSWI